MDTKSHDLMSASWTASKNSGVIQSESEDLRTRAANGVSPSLRAGDETSQLSKWGRKKGASSSFLCLWFNSNPQPTG